MESVTRLFQGFFYFRLVSVSDSLSFLRYSSLFSWGFRLTKTLVSFGLLRRMASLIAKGTDKCELNACHTKRRFHCVGTEFLNFSERREIGRNSRCFS